MLEFPTSYYLPLLRGIPNRPNLPPDTMTLVQEFNNRIAETHSGRTEVQDFVLKSVYSHL